MIVSLRVKPNYSDIINAGKITNNIQILLSDTAIKNKGLMFKNINDALTFLNQNERNVGFNSVYFDGDDIDEEYISEAMEIAKVLDVPLSYYESYKYKDYEEYVEKLKRINKTGNEKGVRVYFQNPDGFCLKEIVSYFFSNGLNISLNISNYVKSCKEYKSDFEVISKTYKDRLFNLVIDYSEIEGVVPFEIKEIFKIFSDSRFINSVVIDIDVGMNIKDDNVRKDIEGVVETIRSLFSVVSEKKGLVMFDADHTLYEINTKKAYSKLYTMLARILKKDKEDIRQLHQKIISKLKKSKVPEKRKINYSLGKILDDKDLVDEISELFWNEVVKDLKPRKCLKEVIKELSYDYDIVIFSDEFRDVLVKKLNKVFPEWEEYVKEIVTPEITKSMKPSLKYYTYILRKYKYPKHKVYVIGDSWERDLEIAKNKGLKTFLLERDIYKDVFDSINDLKEDRGNPDYVVSGLKEIKNIIKKDV